LARNPRRSFLGLLFCNRGGFGSSVGVGLSLDGATHFGGDVFRDGTGVSFLFREAKAGQKVNDRLGLDFELASQLVDSDLIGFRHALRSILWYKKLRIRFGALFL
jgi:hypothetical protein